MLTIVLFAAWLLILVFLKRTRIYFFFFLAGSIGLFCFMMYYGSVYAESFLQKAITYCLWVIGDFIRGLYNAYPEYAMLTVYRDYQAISFFVDYECSGFIEMLVYISLLSFYPGYLLKEKVKYCFWGILYIFLSNILRVVFICLIIKAFGTSMFFLSHTVFARILFFILMVVLYYIVFTRPHILSQKVGNLTYGS